MYVVVCPANITIYHSGFLLLASLSSTRLFINKIFRNKIYQAPILEKTVVQKLIELNVEIVKESDIAKLFFLVTPTMDGRINHCLVKLLPTPRLRFGEPNSQRRHIPKDLSYLMHGQKILNSFINLLIRIIYNLIQFSAIPFIFAKTNEINYFMILLHYSV